MGEGGGEKEKRADPAHRKSQASFAFSNFFLVLLTFEALLPTRIYNIKVGNSKQENCVVQVCIRTLYRTPYSTRDTRSKYVEDNFLKKQNKTRRIRHISTSYNTIATL